MTRVPRATRAWLGTELARWRAEGLVDERAAEELVRRYGLAAGDGARSALFVVYLVGSLLIGGGVLSFVAWNWDRLPGAARLGLGATALATAYGLGHWLAEIDGRRPMLGRALVLVGSLLFGANIGIVAQVFQLGGEFPEAAGLWAAGAALASWALGCVPSGALAAALGGLWAGNRIAEDASPWLAYVPALVLLPRALLSRSPVLYGTVAATTFATLLVAAEAAEGELVLPSALASAALLVALTFALEARLPALATVSRGLGTLATAVLAYVLSFHDVADGVRAKWTVEAVAVAFLPQIVGVAVCLVHAVRTGRLAGRRSVLVTLGACALLLLGSLPSEREVLLASLANLSLCAMAGSWLLDSVQSLDRREFWSSVAVLLGVVVTRFLEYETGLLLKAAVFTACGVAVLRCGVYFERRVRAGRPGHA